MKDLKGYIKEGLFDDVDKLEGKKGLNNNIKLLKKEITDWIVNNNNCRTYKTKLKFDFNTIPVTVNYDGDIIIKPNMTSLTNGIFQWKEVGGLFGCAYCNSITSLKDAPEKVGGNFYCHNCKSLNSLEGAPKEISGRFVCKDCPSLESLEGAPEKVLKYFDCRNCGVQFTVNDVKKVSNVTGGIYT